MKRSSITPVPPVTNPTPIRRERPRPKPQPPKPKAWFYNEETGVILKAFLKKKDMKKETRKLTLSGPFKTFREAKMIAIKRFDAERRLATRRLAMARHCSQ